MQEKDGFANINEKQFIRGPLRAFGRNVLLFRVTNRDTVEDHRGEKTFTYPYEGEQIFAVLHERSIVKERSKAGYVEHAPAYIECRVTEDIKEDDKIQDPISGKAWKVFNPINRNNMFIYSDLYRAEEQA